MCRVVSVHHYSEICRLHGQASPGVPGLTYPPMLTYLPPDSSEVTRKLNLHIDIAMSYVMSCLERKQKRFSPVQPESG